MALLTPRSIEINSLKEKLERLEFEKLGLDWFKEVKSGNIENVKKMIEYKIIEDIDVQDGHGISALLVASSNGHEDIVKFLIERNANINLQSNYNFSSLILAANNGHKDIVKLLIESGANINHQNNDGYSALILASSRGYTDIVKLLIESDANINFRDKNGKNALSWASDNGHKDIIKLLEDHMTTQSPSTSSHEDVVSIKSEENEDNNITIKQLLNDALNKNEESNVIKFLSSYLK